MSLPPIKAGTMTSPTLSEAMHRAQRRRNVPIIGKGVAREESEAMERAEAIQEMRKAASGAGSLAKRSKSKKPDSVERQVTRRESVIRRGSKASNVIKPVYKLKAVRTGAEGIPPVLLQRAQDLFHEFDTDENGSVDAAELMAVMRSLGHELQPLEVAQMLEMVDQNNSGNIDMREFLDLLHMCNETFPLSGRSADASDALSLATCLAGGNVEASADTSIDSQALKKILADDFDLHNFRLEDVLPGPITFGSLQTFLCDGKAY